MNRRHALLGTALIATLAAIYFAPEPASGVVAPTAKAATASAVPRKGASVSRSAGTPLEVLEIRPRLADDEEREAFPPVAWELPPPPPSSKAREEAPPPPPPQAPPLPFKVLGQYAEVDRQGVFLQFNDRNLVAHVGDTIADAYQVESFKDGVLTLLYLPLQQRQTLTVSAAN